jgi:sucrose phosphorylase
MELLERSGVGRDINRHSYTMAEAVSSLDRPMVQRLLELIRLRNSHPAFNGTYSVESVAQNLLSISWKLDSHWIALSVDLVQPSANIEYSTDQADQIAKVQIES